MDAFYELEKLYRSRKDIDNKLASSFNEETLEEAYRLYTSHIDYEHDPNFPKPSDDVISAIKMIDHIIDSNESLDYSIKVARYDLNESFLMLINEIFKK